MNLTSATKHLSPSTWVAANRDFDAGTFDVFLSCAARWAGEAEGYEIACQLRGPPVTAARTAPARRL